MDIKLNLIPLKSVGPFKFGDNILKYKNLDLIEEFYNEFDKFDYEVDRRVFKLLEDEKYEIRLYTENDSIDTILCDKYLFYNDINLIGVKFEEFEKIIDSKYDEKSIEKVIDENQDVYEYVKLGLQVWVDNNGRIVTIICGPFIED